MGAFRPGAGQPPRRKECTPETEEVRKTWLAELSTAVLFQNPDQRGAEVRRGPALRTRQRECMWVKESPLGIYSPSVLLFHQPGNTLPLASLWHLKCLAQLLENAEFNI